MMFFSHSPDVLQPKPISTKPQRRKGGHDEERNTLCTG
jgi:hypothetical protein